MNTDGSRIRDISPSGRKSSEVQVTVKDVKLSLSLSGGSLLNSMSHMDNMWIKITFLVARP